MSGASLAIVLLEHLVLTALPAVAATLLAARWGVSRVPVLLAVALAASGAIAMLTFWAFYAEPVIGETVSYLVLFGSVALTAWLLYERQVDSALLRALAVPLGLWVLGTVFLAYFGFLHGDVNAALGTSANRFTASSLPSDNDIPFFYADWFFKNGHAGTPPEFPGGWFSSDRPPLQIGFVMPQMAIAWGKGELDYQVLGVALQQLWIVGAWALLLAARLGRTTRALALLTLLLSDLVIVNGFFVWPKLLPAAMLLAVAALVLTPLWAELRRSYWGAALIAALCGLAMMGHGSSVFGILALVLIGIFRGVPSWRWLGIAVGVGIVVIVPWSAYQSYGDPPGNRLNKWFLAGVVEIDRRGVLESISDSYGEAGVSGAVDNKLKNAERILGWNELVANSEVAVDYAGEGRWADVVRQVRTNLFLFLVPSLGLLLLGPVAMALRRRHRAERRTEWDFALACLATFALGTVAWALILYGGDNAPTVVHQGSYLIPALGILGCAVGLRAVLPRFAVWWLALNAALTLAIFAPVLAPGAGTEVSLPAIFIAMAGLAGFGFLAWGRGRGGDGHGAAPDLQTAG